MSYWTRGQQVAHPTRLLEQAHAGQEIILAKAGKPYARMMPLAPEASKRQRGRVKSINDDAFFDPLPDEALAAWEGRAG